MKSLKTKLPVALLVVGAMAGGGGAAAVAATTSGESPVNSHAAESAHTQVSRISGGGLSKADAPLFVAGRRVHASEESGVITEGVPPVRTAGGVDAGDARDHGAESAGEPAHEASSPEETSGDDEIPAIPVVRAK